MRSGLLSRRTFLGGAVLGGAGGVVTMTGIHAVSHAAASSDDTTQSDHSASHVDIGFCTDMSAHHVQALDMCERVLGQDTGGAVQSAATEVLRNQSIEVGMMRAWLTDWGASTAPPETVMAWMAHSMDSETPMEGEMAMDMSDGIPLADMPGYASAEELSALALADGEAKGRLWLELMRAHHVGGVAMAEAALELASEEKVTRLARTQAEVQAYEISQYDLLLSTIYAV